ncbi:MAG: hypothetical protein OI715_00465 (plasmid) [Candidatus Methanoperedens sp.]|nr:MAG: hypothetical protein OI715_00465 [Candidatus Methanoperedens sp.]
MTVTGSNIQGNYNTTISVQTDKSIPFPKKFEIGIENLRTFNKELDNVVFELPNDKEAFIPRMIRDEKYILFYTNEDLSEISIPEKYVMNKDREKEICWVAGIWCNNNQCNSSIMLNPKDINRLNPESCYKI